MDHLIQVTSYKGRNKSKPDIKDKDPWLYQTVDGSHGRNCCGGSAHKKRKNCPGAIP